MTSHIIDGWIFEYVINLRLYYVKASGNWNGFDTFLRELECQPSLLQALIIEMLISFRNALKPFLFYCTLFTVKSFAVRLLRKQLNDSTPILRAFNSNAVTIIMSIEKDGDKNNNTFFIQFIIPQRIQNLIMDQFCSHKTKDSTHQN